MSRRPGRLVLRWCQLYTLAVPPLERERRRAEMASHIADSFAASGSGARARRRVVCQCLAGAVDDLAWCNDVRTNAGQRGLVAATFLGSLGSSAIAGMAMVMAFLLSLTDGSPYPTLKTLALAVAAAVTVVSLADRTWDWLQRRNH